jgi:hypothetical protein
MANSSMRTREARSHWNSRGMPKVGYQSMAAAEHAARRMDHEPYKCGGECEEFHTGGLAGSWDKYTAKAGWKATKVKGGKKAALAAKRARAKAQSKAAKAGR